MMSNETDKKFKPLSPPEWAKRPDEERLPDGGVRLLVRPPTFHPEEFPGMRDGSNDGH